MTLFGTIRKKRERSRVSTAIVTKAENINNHRMYTCTVVRKCACDYAEHWNPLVAHKWLTVPSNYTKYSSYVLQKLFCSSFIAPGLVREPWQNFKVSTKLFKYSTKIVTAKKKICILKLGYTKNASGACRRWSCLQIL